MKSCGQPLSTLRCILCAAIDQSGFLLRSCNQRDEAVLSPRWMDEDGVAVPGGSQRAPGDLEFP